MGGAIWSQSAEAAFDFYYLSDFEEGPRRNPSHLVGKLRKGETYGCSEPHFSKLAKGEEPDNLTVDPHGVNNLATDPKPKAKLDAMRTRLTDWEGKTKDQICKLEPMAMYDSG